MTERWEDKGTLQGVMKSGNAEIGLMRTIAARGKENGITLTMEPHDTEWKTRAFEVTEPSGFKITFAREQ